MKFLSKKYAVLFCFFLSCSNSFPKESALGFLVLNGIGVCGHALTMGTWESASKYRYINLMREFTIFSHCVFGEFNIAGFLLMPSGEKQTEQKKLKDLCKGDKKNPKEKMKFGKLDQEFLLMGLCI